MGGGGGGGYFPSSPGKFQKLIGEAKEQAERDRSEGEINEFLNKLLVSLNARDVDQIQEHLEKIADVLGSAFDFEQFLFGGSVAKHTFVDGLSDVDALVIIDREDLGGKSPQTILREFHKELQDKLTYDAVQKVEKGTLAVTVTYRDGTEIQLLPAIKQEKAVAIANPSGKGWNQINPKAFQRDLTRANQRLNNMLVPTIKLAKSLVSNLPQQKQLSGYHVETLAVEVFRGYDGKKTPKAMLTHFCEQASKRVLQPIKDTTGQSSSVDSDLGKARSNQRRVVSDALAGVARKLKAAGSVSQWKKLLEV